MRLSCAPDGIGLYCPSCGTFVRIVEESGVDLCSFCGAAFRVVVEWKAPVQVSGK